MVTSTVKMSSWVTGGGKKGDDGTHWRMIVNSPAYLGDKHEFAEGVQVDQGSGVDDVEGEHFDPCAGDGCSHEDLLIRLR